MPRFVIPAARLGVDALNTGAVEIYSRVYGVHSIGAPGYFMLSLPTPWARTNDIGKESRVLISYMSDGPFRIVPFDLKKDP